MVIAVVFGMPASVSASAEGASQSSWYRAESAPTTTIPGDDSPVATTLDNPFIPEDANIGDCVSALPRPGCGSEARGGWRQTLVFVVLVAGMALIGWRLVVAVRRRDRATMP
jgi:hypothetical protein